MPRIDNHRFYISALKTYGQTPRGVHWLSDRHQTIRFDVILSLLPKNLKKFSLADAGCGFGDFYTYMKNKPMQYLGIDSEKEMLNITCNITSAQTLLADICKDKLPKKDYYICSGALNILTIFETYQFIANCYKSCHKGFVFNALHGNKVSKTYNYLNKEKLEDIAKNLNVQNIVYKEGYLENDITVGFFK